MKRIAICLAAALFVLSCTCSGGSGKPADNPPVEPEVNTEEEPVIVEPEGFRIVAVDLGVSVKWANANIGASAPEEAGDYYAWGETQTKDKFDWESYRWCKGAPGAITRYNTDESYGRVDNLSVLKTGPDGDDVASIVLGGAWRMPTQKEWDELLAKCKWTRTEVGGMKGFLVEGAGNSIFIPAAGSRDGRRISHVGEDGFYWSSSLLTDDPNAAWSMHFGKYGTAETYMYHYRNYGQTIRPVMAE